MGSAAASWPTPPMKFPNSGPSSTYSGSPARSGLNLPVITPRPVPAGASFDMWHFLPSDQRQGLTQLCPRAVSCLDDAALRCTFRRWRGRPRIRDAVRWHVYWYGRVLVGLDPDPRLAKTTSSAGSANDGWIRHTDTPFPYRPRSNRMRFNFLVFNTYRCITRLTASLLIACSTSRCLVV